MNLVSGSILENILLGLVSHEYINNCPNDSSVVHTEDTAEHHHHLITL